MDAQLSQMTVLQTHSGQHPLLGPRLSHLLLPLPLSLWCPFQQRGRLNGQCFHDSWKCTPHIMLWQHFINWGIQLADDDWHNSSRLSKYRGHSWMKIWHKAKPLTPQVHNKEAHNDMAANNMYQMSQVICALTGHTPHRWILLWLAWLLSWLRPWWHHPNMSAHQVHHLQQIPKALHIPTTMGFSFHFIVTQIIPLPSHSRISPWMSIKLFIWTWLP